MAASRRIHPARISLLGGQRGSAGRYVLYWMQQSQRAEFNHALEFAAQRANDLGQPLVTVFCLVDGYPGANLRHCRFMLEGLRGTAAALERRGIRFVMRRGAPGEVVPELGRRATEIVCDRGYLRHQKAWRRGVAAGAQCPVYQVESDVVVPVEAASGKAEYAARTLRPKIHRRLEEFLVPLRPTPLRRDSLGQRIEGLDPGDVDALLARLDIDRSVPPVPFFEGGTLRAKRVFRRFLSLHLDGYAAQRNRPGTDFVSHMGMYLHFGQISPLYLALVAGAAGRGLSRDRDVFLEELLVRRELACNFVHFTPDYDRFSCLPAWARATLHEHRRDRRPRRYSPAELDAAATHDPYWNAAMREMKHSGYMHNYMRMYWGKKILEWSGSPRGAFRTALCLNNRYFIDGRDPNSYAGVGWIFGLHDRPWARRSVFGSVRYMSAGGLERKADPEAYIEKVDALEAELARVLRRAAPEPGATPEPGAAPARAGGRKRR